MPIGVNSRISAPEAGGDLVLTGMVASLDGQRLIRDEVSGPQEDPEALGIGLAQRMRERGAGAILEEIFATVRPEA